MVSYTEFREDYKKHHTCGIQVGIPAYLCFDSGCPRCCPDLPQWKNRCHEDYERYIKEVE